MFWYRCLVTVSAVCLQLIFRKLADVKREKELAEKRKNDPPLELSQDHPVRKLISRFRKISDKTSQNNLDVEKAEQKPNNVSPNERPSSGSGARVIKVSESNNANLQVQNNQTKAVSKWGKLLSGTGGGGGTATTVTNALGTAGNATTPSTPNITQNATGAAPAVPKPKPALSKWGKLMGKKQETIEEKSEEEEAAREDKSNLKREVSIKSAFQKKPAEPLAAASSDEAPVTQRDVVFSVAGSSNFSATEQQLIASLYDIKLEIKEEIEALNQKMNKIDLQIGDILKMFSPQSSPFSSQTHSSLSSQGHSSSDSGSCNSSTCSNSIGVSPRGSLPSSPHHHHHHHHHRLPHQDSLPQSSSVDSGSRPGTPSQGAGRKTSPPSKVSGAVTPSVGAVSKPGLPRKPMLEQIRTMSHSQIGHRTPRGSMDGDRSTPTEQPPMPATSSPERTSGSAGSSGGESSSSTVSRRNSKRKKAMGRKRVAPSDTDEALGGVQPARDDDTIHVKDRDLDIL